MPETRGRLSGIGVAVGYLGTIFSGLLLIVFDVPLEGRFLVAAVLFAIFSIPIFLVTSMTREPDRFWGLRQGADEFLPKPVDPELLVEKVRARLP